MSETEALRTELFDENRALRAEIAARQELQAVALEEIERLRQVQTAIKADLEMRSQVLEAEVERLNDLVHLYGKRIESFSSEAAEGRAEIERLKSAVTDLGVAHIQAHIEAERLRAALTEITELDLEGDASLADALTIADEALNPPPLGSHKAN